MMYSTILKQSSMFPPTRYQPAPNPQFLVNLEFSLRYRYMHFRIPLENSNQPELLWASNTFFSDTRAVLDLPHLLSREKALETIGQIFESWSLSGRERRKLADTVLRRAREGVVSTHAGHNVINIGLIENLVYENFIQRRRQEITVIERVIRRSIDDDVVRMVPTDEWAIESSLSTTGLIEETSRCVICIDEFVKGCEVVSMPCAHVFHGVCIRKWLRTSHYCPVCRFEMPTRDHRFGH